MKRIAFCLLCFLLALPVHAQEYDYVAGAGGAASCGVIDQQTGGTAANAIVGYDTTTDRVYVVSSFTASSTATIHTLYLQMSRISTPTATLTVSLCTGKNTGCTAADNTQASGSLGTSYAEIKFQFAAGFSVTATTAYYIQVQASAIDAAKYAQVLYNSAQAGAVYEYSPDGSNWTQVDSSAQFVFRATSCAE